MEKILTTELATESERRWGSGGINLAEKSLPSLKAQRAFETVMSLPGGARILDYGCGEGKLLRTLYGKRSDFKLFGADIQKPLSNPNFFEFKLISDEEDPLFNEPFDRIFSLDVLEHVPDLDSTLMRISKMLKDDGRFVLFVPLEGKAFSPFGFYRWILGADLYIKTKSHVHAYRQKSFIEMLKKYFDVEEVNYSYHAFGTLLDSTFFALCGVLDSLSSWFWKKNSLYRPENKNKGLLNKAMELANVLCFFESTLLRRSSFLASGLHVTAKKKTSSEQSK